jgi:hypothetical protein
MSYDDFPWFKDAPVGKILNVEEPTPGHFYWPLSQRAQPAVAEKLQRWHIAVYEQA